MELKTITTNDEALKELHKVSIALQHIGNAIYLIDNIANETNNEELKDYTKYINEKRDIIFSVWSNCFEYRCKIQAKEHTKLSYKLNKMFTKIMQHVKHHLKLK